MSNSANETTKEMLLIELEKELHYHQNGGTAYRVQTTQLSIQVVNQVSDVICFINKKKAYDIVAGILPKEDEHRLQDISKMLSIIVRDLEMQKNLPADVRAFVDEKMKDFDSLKFKKD